MDIETIEVFKYVALVLQMSVVLVGFPAQVSKNYRENRCGEAGIKLYLVLSTFSVRLVPGYAGNVWYIYIPDTIAVVILFITFLQLKWPRNAGAAVVHGLYSRAVSIVGR